jgi:lysine-ketoglutarate reductase/saccharopine dehydrogenase-like protein (TIGR00300 family)
MSGNGRVLMCAPAHYGVEYVINPWMAGNIHRVARENAVKQWEELRGRLEELVEVELLEPAPGLPDMVFTANGGFLLEKKAVLSRFLYRERQDEREHFRRWFKKAGYEVADLPGDIPFEGEGDALLDPQRGVLWVGYGMRTDLGVHPALAEVLDLRVVSLRLADERFYHLDTCLCPLERGWLLYYPRAFDADSILQIEQLVPEDKRIAISGDDAAAFACNVVNIGDHIVMNKASPDLKEQLGRAGFNVIETPLDEFMKAGGAAKCLVLRLTNHAPAAAGAATSVREGIVTIEGHLLHAGLLEKAVDVVVENGGAFQVLHFDLGKQQASVSRAEMRVVAPSELRLNGILSQLLSLGAKRVSAEESDAVLVPAPIDGVAPDDFYASTIYPTEVRVAGTWIPVLNQRMDGVIVVEPGAKPVARCALFRTLGKGDLVVTGSAGLRTRRKLPKPALTEEHEFSFMGAGVSSERRVDLVVERIAWEMGRWREQKGRIVVVAGPVVIHTGGGEHLARLVRNGYVQALLGGNAIAVHDIEQALLGTSLGVDLVRGAPVDHGHRHHLAAINTIRRCGGIRQAVEQGVLTRGVFYECVRAGVPFSLAGSIRDDGPLPDTQMDLIKAQDDYTRLVRGADMVLMLSSMLHSIGVGNMTPAGVRLACIDINPAVVTKLADRGSLESVGVVTDVGLFLSLLLQRLGL